jgi:hypothetical protein
VIAPQKLGWMAAVLDVQGHVIQKKNAYRATPQVVVMAESRHRRVINGLCELTGSSVEEKQQPPLPAEWRRRGCIEHCPDAHIHHAGEFTMPMTSRWTITGVAVAVVLHSVLPYIVMDDKGYADAYQVCMENAVLAGRGSGATKVAIRRLMALGWELPPGWVDKLVIGEDEEPVVWTEDAVLELVQEITG